MSARLRIWIRLPSWAHPGGPNLPSRGRTDHMSERVEGGGPPHAYVKEIVSVLSGLHQKKERKVYKVEGLRESFISVSTYKSYREAGLMSQWFFILAEAVANLKSLMKE